jgi:hypothetical protein
MMSRAAADLELSQIEEKGGDKVDAKIRPIVVSLMALGFPTWASCEGHAERTGGGQTLYPWILFSNESKGSLRSNKMECFNKTQSQLHDLRSLLQKFYEHRSNLPVDQLLTIRSDISRLDDMPLYGSEERGFFYSCEYYLQCAGADVLEMLPLEVLGAEGRERVVRRHQSEMGSFGNFLLNQFGE